MEAPIPKSKEEEMTQKQTINRIIDEVVKASGYTREGILGPSRRSGVSLARAIVMDALWVDEDFTQIEAANAVNRTSRWATAEASSRIAALLEEGGADGNRYETWSIKKRWTFLSGVRQIK